MIRDAETHQPVEDANVRVRVEVGEIPAWMEGPTYATDPADSVGRTDAEGVFYGYASPAEPMVVMVWLGWIPYGAVRYQSMPELGSWQVLPGPSGDEGATALEILVRPRD